MASPRVVLITGCSTGIGLSTAVLLAQKGFKVYATLRNLDKKADLAEQGKEWLDKNLFIEQLDVCSDESVEKCFQKIMDKEGRLDVLVNNAGVGLVGPLEAQTMDSWKSLMETNFFGVLRITKAFLPGMKKNKSGHIINISSQAGLKGAPLSAVYCASKFALEGLSESLAVECKVFDIKVSVIEPGAVGSAFAGSILEEMSKSDQSNVDDVTKELDSKVKGFLTNSLKMMSQTPTQIAEVILEALVAESPHFRYQTNPIFKESNEKKFVDTTGDSNIAMTSARFFPTVGQK